MGLVSCGILPDQGSNPWPFAVQGRFLTTGPPRKRGRHFWKWPTWAGHPKDNSYAAAMSIQSCPTLRPHRRKPTSLPRLWDSPGKNTGVSCHFLLQSMKVKTESEVAQSCPILSDPMDYSPPGSSIHGIFQARVLEWGAHCLLRG